MGAPSEAGEAGEARQARQAREAGAAHASGRRRALGQRGRRLVRAAAAAPRAHHVRVCAVTFYLNTKDSFLHLSCVMIRQKPISPIHLTGITTCDVAILKFLGADVTDFGVEVGPE